MNDLKKGTYNIEGIKVSIGYYTYYTYQIIDPEGVKTPIKTENDNAWNEPYSGIVDKSVG